MKAKRKIISDVSIGRLTFKFKAAVWVWEGPAAWHFTTLPTELSHEISELFADQKRGFGSLPVEVSISDLIWQTSIFPDKKRGGYLLPLKKEILKKASLAVGEIVEFKIAIAV